MKATVNIPDKIYNLYIENNKLTRRELMANGCSEYEAKIYSWLLKNGETINDTRFIPNPESGTRKTLIIADLHAPYINQRNLDIALEYGVKNDIDELVLAGDGVDLKPVSFWFSRELEDLPFEVELEQAKDILRYVSNSVGDISKVYINGNHETRMLSYICKNAGKIKNGKIGNRAIASTKDWLDIDSMGFKWVDNLELIQAGLPAFHIGNLFILHGHEPAKVTYTAINPAKLYWERIVANAVVFHLHRTAEWIVHKPLDRSYEGVWCGGCLCDMHPNYSVMNKWVPGFVFVERGGDGLFSVRNLKIIDGKAV